jgi:membrane-bound lytic murein transglycosylase D
MAMRNQDCVHSDYQCRTETRITGIRRGLIWIRWGAVLCAGAAGFAADAPAPTAAPAASVPDSDDVYQAARQLYDQLAPPEVKQEYDFPSRQQFEAFAQTLQAALDGDSLEELAKHESEARSALAFLRSSPEFADYADWLAPRLDEISAARSVLAVANPTPVPSTALHAPTAVDQTIPYYDLWFRRLGARPPPANARVLMPRLRSAFAAEGVPPGLAWLAEVESSFNPNARNPSGAKGLYQMKAATAQSLGLSTFLPDDRTDPEKSAHAAAHLLKDLRERFGSWPLALAAYNAGEGRVSRDLAARHATTYAAIASELPAGTRLYVPEVCALVAVRTGHRLE